MKEYERVPLTVTARKYEVGQHLEDGFELYTKVVTNGWISTEGLVKITRPDGSVVCPFIQNRRGLIFIREGDYIIYDGHNQRHVCGEDRFHERYHEISN